MKTAKTVQGRLKQAHSGYQLGEARAELRGAAAGVQVHCSLESSSFPVLGCNLGSIPTAPRYASVRACDLLTPAWPWVGLCYLQQDKSSCEQVPVYYTA